MSLPGKWVAFDPGESTGYAVCEGNRLVEAGTADLEDVWAALSIAFNVVGSEDLKTDLELVRRFRGAELVVYEDWALYPWKAQELAWDQCRTARLIGKIELLCDLAGVRYEAQPAKIKETAEAAGAADLFLRPLDENRHANDACRHAVYRALKSGEGVVPG